MSMHSFVIASPNIALPTLFTLFILGNNHRVPGKHHNLSTWKQNVYIYLARVGRFRRDLATTITDKHSLRVKQTGKFQCQSLRQYGFVQVPEPVFSVYPRSNRAVRDLYSMSARRSFGPDFTSSYRELRTRRPGVPFVSCDVEFADSHQPS